jgi:hypothetical protein
MSCCSNPAIAVTTGCTYRVPLLKPLKVDPEDDEEMAVEKEVPLSLDRVNWGTWK